MAFSSLPILHLSAAALAAGGGTALALSGAE